MTTRLAALVTMMLLTALAATPAHAACPGAVDPCPYTAVSQLGQRGGGVLRFPQAIAVSPAGVVYVGDQSSHVVQVFQLDGRWIRDIGAAGTRPGELSAVAALGVAGDGSVLAADGGSDRIVRFAPDGTLLNTFGGRGTDIGEFHFGAGGGHDAPAGGGLAVAGDTVYIADTGNDRLLRFTVDGGHGAQIVPPGMLLNPRGVAVRRTRLFVADDHHHRVVVLDTGGRLLKVIGGGQGTAPGQLNFPFGVGLDPQGRVFVADDLNHRVVRFSTSPNYPYKARWGAYGQAPGRLAFPRGLAVDAEGRIYVANTGNDRIDVFDRSGKLLWSFGTSGRGPGQYNAPLGVAADASGIRAVADSINGRIQLLNPDGSLASIWGSPNPGPTVLPKPVAVAFDAVGNAYVLDERRSRIVVFDRATGIPSRTIGVLGNGPGQLSDPAALAIDSAGVISVADAGNERIARFSTAGEYLGSTELENTPRGIAVTPDGGRTYVSDTRNRITVFDPSGGQLAQFGGNGRTLGKLSAPAQIALDPAGNLWVADRGNNRVQKFGPDGQRLLMFGQRGTDPGAFIHPTGVAVDCHGALTVTDAGNNRVQQFALASPPATTCATLPPVATPPAPQVPTLPLPDGPVLDARALRKARILSLRSIPLSVECDTTCQLTAEATVTPLAKPPKKHRTVSITLKTVTASVDAAQPKVVRLSLTRTQANRLRKALHRHRRLEVSVQLTGAASAGTPTSLTLRFTATA